MKKWIVTLIIIFVALVAAAATARLWFPLLWKFTGDKSTNLSGLTGLIQAVLVALGVFIAWMTLRVALKQLRQSESSKNSIQAARDVNQAGGNIQTGGITTNAPGEGDVFQGVKVGRDQINVGNAFFGTQTPPISSLHQLPPPPRDFTGREEELKELIDKLKDGGISIFGLRGMGGIGKTALALVLADRLAPDYPDGQFYLDLKGTKDKGAKPLTPAEAMAHVIRGYYPEAKLPEDEGELKGLYNSVLQGERALLLMDNALDAAQVIPLIPPDGNVLLITSRQHFHLSGIFPKDLNTLRPADAKELLLKIAPNIGTCADEIAQLCGYLPFALLNAGGALADQHIITPAEYAERLTEAKTRLELVDASLSLSYDLLDKEMQKLWRMLAVFPDSFDSAAAAAVWGITRESADEKLNALINRSLVDCDETSRRCRLHDLARVFAESRITDKDERYAAQKEHAEHYKNVLAAADNLYKQGGEAIMQGLALFDLEWIDIRAGQAWASQNAAADEMAAKLCNEYPDAGVYVLDLRLHPREKISWLEAALSAARKLKYREAEGVHLGNLGLAYAELGETRRAIEYHEKALALDREIGAKRAEGHNLGNLGLAYADLGETRRAIEFYEKSLEIDREIGDRRGEGNALGNLGNAYYLSGETRRAIEYYEKALAINREIGDKRAEGHNLGNLGVAYNNLAETRRAIEYHEKALVVIREIGDKRAEGQILGNQGLAYKNLGETRRAIEFYEKALQIDRDIGDRRGEGADLFNMSVALDMLGQRKEAIAKAEAALVIHEQIEDPNAAKARQWLEGKRQK